MQHSFSVLISYLQKKEEFIDTQHTYANQDLADLAQTLDDPSFRPSMIALDECLSNIRKNTSTVFN